MLYVAPCSPCAEPHEGTEWDLVDLSDLHVLDFGKKSLEKHIPVSVKATGATAISVIFLKKVLKLKLVVTVVAFAPKIKIVFCPFSTHPENPVYADSIRKETGSILFTS